MTKMNPSMAMKEIIRPIPRPSHPSGFLLNSMQDDDPQLPVSLQQGFGRRPVLQAKTTMGRVQYSTARALVYKLLKAMPKLRKSHENEPPESS